METPASLEAASKRRLLDTRRQGLITLPIRGARAGAGQGELRMPGGLAQLGERLDGIQKVRGSSPLSSTSVPADCGKIRLTTEHRAFLKRILGDAFLLRTTIATIPLYRARRSHPRRRTP